MPTIFSNDWFINKWAKIHESTWTRIFIITSIIQTILVIALESRVFYRNDSIRKNVEGHNGIPGYESCDFQYSTQRMIRIEQENAIFMIVQLYQLWFCFNAIFAQNTIQLIAITIMNSLCAGYSIVQIMEIRIWYADLNKHCFNAFPRESNTAKYDLPLVTTLIAFAIIIGFLAFKLYQQFGWVIYRRIGGSLETQAIYRKQLILVILLKIDLLALLLFSIESWMTFTLESETEKLEHLYYVPRELYYFHRFVTFSVIVLEFIAYRSMKKEWRLGMYIFIFLWMAVIADLIVILCFSIRTARDSWYFLICFVIFSIVVSSVTWIYSILVTKDFGSGLSEILMRFENKTSEVPMNERPKLTRRLSLD